MDVDEYGRCECCGKYVKEETLTLIRLNNSEVLYCEDCYAALQELAWK